MLRLRTIYRDEFGRLDGDGSADPSTQQGRTGRIIIIRIR
jgi:hypothetical protein